MKQIILTFLILFFFSISVQIINAQAQKTTSNADKLIGLNLIKNPGAEKVTSTNKPEDWKMNLDNSDYVSSYGHTAGEWDNDCDAKCGLPEKAGSYYFRAATSIEDGQRNKFLQQTINLSQLQDTLAVREIKFILSTQIAGFHCSIDSKCAFGYLKVEFFDPSNQALKIYEVKKYANEFHRIDESEGADSRMHKFENLALSGIVPINAIQAIVTIGATNNCLLGTEGANCGDTYAFFDNLNLILSKSNKR